MDLVTIFKPIIDFFIKFCAVNITVGGFSFSVGALFIWCALATIVISFIRGLAS